MQRRAACQCGGLVRKPYQPKAGPDYSACTCEMGRRRQVGVAPDPTMSPLGRGIAFTHSHSFAPLLQSQEVPLTQVVMATYQVAQPMQRSGCLC